MTIGCTFLFSENINTSKEAESVAFPVSIRESLDIVHGSGSPVKGKLENETVTIIMFHQGVY